MADAPLCLYCKRPIEPEQERVEGDAAVAHRVCLDDRIEADAGPGWRENLNGRRRVSNEGG
jgi:hypothetical protein